MLIRKLPILPFGGSRDVFFLALALYVGLLVLRRIEHSFRLLGRHARYGFGCGRLILTLGRRRIWVLTLATAAAASPATASTATSLSLSERQLVIPSRIRVGHRDLQDLLVPVERAIERGIGGIFFRTQSLHQAIETQIEPRVVTHFCVLRIGSASERWYRRRQRIAHQKSGASIVERNRGLVALQ